MNDIDIPILNKTYELYKIFHGYRKVVSKSDRFAIYERSENLIVDVVELLLEAGYTKSINKLASLDKASIKLNTLRLLIRLMKESFIFDTKKYIVLQKMIDDIGRQLGGWIRSNGLQ